MYVGGACHAHVIDVFARTELLRRLRMIIQAASRLN